jgi:hypothetical protein
VHAWIEFDALGIIVNGLVKIFAFNGFVSFGSLGFGPFFSFLGVESIVFVVEILLVIF